MEAVRSSKVLKVNFEVNECEACDLLERLRSSRVPSSVATELRTHLSDFIKDVQLDELAHKEIEKNRIDRGALRSETLTLKATAKLLDVRQDWFFREVIEHHILYRNESGFLIAYPAYISKGYFAVYKGTSKQTKYPFTQARVTQAGLAWLAGEIPKWKDNLYNLDLFSDVAACN